MRDYSASLGERSRIVPILPNAAVEPDLKLVKPNNGRDGPDFLPLAQAFCFDLMPELGRVEDIGTLLAEFGEDVGEGFAVLSVSFFPPLYYAAERDGARWWLGGEGGERNRGGKEGQGRGEGRVYLRPSHVSTSPPASAPPKSPAAAGQAA